MNWAVTPNKEIKTFCSFYTMERNCQWWCERGALRQGMKPAPSVAVRSGDTNLVIVTQSGTFQTLVVATGCSYLLSMAVWCRVGCLCLHAPACTAEMRSHQFSEMFQHHLFLIGLYCVQYGKISCDKYGEWQLFVHSGLPANDVHQLMGPGYVLDDHGIGWCTLPDLMTVLHHFCGSRSSSESEASSVVHSENSRAHLSHLII